MIDCLPTLGKRYAKRKRPSISGSYPSAKLAFCLSLPITAFGRDWRDFAKRADSASGRTLDHRCRLTASAISVSQPGLRCMQKRLGALMQKVTSRSVCDGPTLFDYPACGTEWPPVKRSPSPWVSEGDRIPGAGVKLIPPTQIASPKCASLIGRNTRS
jgi:hypothetical protein